MRRVTCSSRPGAEYASSSPRTESTARPPSRSVVKTRSGPTACSSTSASPPLRQTTQATAAVPGERIHRLHRSVRGNTRALSKEEAMELGIGFSSEELGPNEIVRAAALAEEVGFTAAWVSDHYHPWIDAQGESPFVWSVLGGIAQATERLRLGTGVTCPIMRIHPAILAQAAATTQRMCDGRFWFGVGSGEALNEHIVALKWPEADVRLAMLEEAVDVIRTLWRGGVHSHYGRFFTVE